MGLLHFGERSVLARLMFREDFANPIIGAMSILATAPMSRLQALAISGGRGYDKDSGKAKTPPVDH